MTRLPLSATFSQIAEFESNSTWRSRVRDFIELTKPRIVALELLTVIVGAYLASPLRLAPGTLFMTILGAGLVAASAGAINQWWERSTDSRMSRTANRPLPGGRLNTTQVLAFGGATLVIGAAVLVIGVNASAALVALATWLIYVLAYTPLKSRSSINTAVGALSGALPILIGWSATGAAIDLRAVSLVGVMFLWQFPHFMAIAWLYRAEYERAGLQMLTVVDPTGLRAGAQALSGALLLIPVSLVPALAPQAGSPTIYCVWAIGLGCLQATAAALFFFRRNQQTARRLLRASLLYLTSWMGLLLIVSV